MNILLAPRQRPCYDETSLKCYEANHRECGNDTCRAVVECSPYLLTALIIIGTILLFKAGRGDK